jgi:hypothetical protein
MEVRIYLVSDGSVWSLNRAATSSAVGGPASTSKRLLAHHQHHTHKEREVDERTSGALRGVRERDAATKERQGGGGAPTHPVRRLRRPLKLM